MLPGKKYTPEDFLLMAWKRKWFILIPTIVIGAGTFIWAQTLPNRYRAETTILVVPQRVPESYVRSTITADISERLQTIQQQILSRTRLERIIDEFNLYPEDRKTMIMEDVVERMRVRDIKLRITGSRRGADTSSFSVGFESSSPRTSVQVTERLASMFVQESLQDRAVLADSTNAFLQAQLDDARRRLQEHEAKLAEFRLRNAGRLPTQAQSNLQLMTTTQTRIQASAEASYRDRDRLMQLETQMAELSAVPAEVVPPPPTEGAPGTIAQQLEAARAGLRNMELRLKPEHPDIARAKRVIRELETKAESEALNAPVSTDSAAALPSGLAVRLTAMRQEVEEIRARIEARKREDARLQGDLAGYTNRLEAAPALESELINLMRDYSTIQEQYTALLRKSEESKISVNLERRQIGEQFKIVDGARLPERPVSPDRFRLNMMGLLGGLALGLALVAFLEYRDTTFKTDDDVIVSLALPVLAVIPKMVTVLDRRRQKRRRVLLTLSASLTTVLVVAGILAWRMDLIAWVR